MEHRLGYPWTRSWILLLLLLAGCIRTAPPPVIRQYTLAYAPPAEGLATLPAVVQVEQPLQTAPDCATLDMLSAEGDYRLTEEPYRRWRATPGRLVGHFLRRDLQRSGGFRAVVGPDSRLRPTHVIEGVVEAFYRVAEGGRPAALLTVSLTLLGSADRTGLRRPLYQRRYTRRAAAQGLDAEALAAAMSGAMADLSRQVVEDVYRIVAAGGNP